MKEQLKTLEKENAELREQCAILADCNTCVSACKTENIEMKMQLETLEKENAKLKERNGELAGQKASLERWFGEAKMIIKNLLSCCRNYPQENVEKIQQAEQFLKEIKNNDN